MKNTHTHILRNIALSLLIVVTLASFTNVFSANITYAQAAAAPAEAGKEPVKTAEAIKAEKDAAEAKAAKDKQKAAEKAAGEELTATKNAADKKRDEAILAAEKNRDAEIAAATDEAAKTAAQTKFNAANNAAIAEHNATVTAATTKYNTAVAAASPATAPGSTIGGQSVGSVLPNNDIIVMLSKVLSIILSMISQLLWPLLMFAGGLMKSDFLYTGAIDLKLSEMWIQVRNLVNIAYVLLLLAVALYNVVGLGETVSMLELKKALPKIIIGLVLVNFSYAGVKVVLDVINVGTTFAFSIGQTDARLTQATLLEIQKAQGPICDTIGGGGKLAENIAKDAKNKAIATQCAGKTGTAASKCESDINQYYSSKGSSSSSAMCVPDKNGKLVINDKVQRYLKSWNVDSSLMIIAIKFMNIQDLPKVSAAAAKGGIAALTINMLFSLVMFLIYAVSFVVLVVVLFTRAAVLWMIIIFSPVIVLNATFPIPGVGGNSSKIVKTLIAPMLIGFVLSIGFILLATMQNINYNGQGTLTSGAPTSSIDTFQDLLVAIGSVVFLWYGIKTATSDTISDKITGPILEGAQTAGTWLAKAPFKYTPLFQVVTPHAGHHELQDMGKIGVGLDQAMYAVEHMGDKFKSDRIEDTQRIFGLGNITLNLKDAKTIEDFTKVIKLKNGDLKETLADHDGALKSFDYMATHAPFKNTTEFKEAHEAIRKNAASKGANTSEADDAERKVRRLLDKQNPSWQNAAPAPATPQTPAQQINTTMKADAVVVQPVIVAMKSTTPPPPAATAAAIQKHNTALVGSGMASLADRAAEIAKLYTEEGVKKASRTAAMTAATIAALTGPPPKMSAADAAALVAAINAAP